MLVAIDVGYSHTKGATDGRRAIFPSVWGEVQQAHLDLDLASRDGYVQIETDDGTWFIGDAAIEQSGLQSRRQDRGWISTPEYQALVMAAITELTGSTGITIQMVTGLPVAYYADRGDLVKRLRKIHQVRRAERRSQRLTVSDVIVIPQGLAAVLSEALDDRGKIRPGPIAEGKVGLLDIGGHTVNVATFNKLREIARQTASMDVGMWGPLAEIGKRINAAFPGQELRGHAVIEAIRAGHIRHYGEERDVAGIARDVLRPFARRIVDEASQIWGSAAQLDVLLIAGGGANVVGPTLLGEYSHARVVSDPQWANVNGYIKFGRRQYGDGN